MSRLGRQLIGAVTAPVCWVPVVVGIVVAVAANGIWTWLGLAAVIAGAGSGIWRLTFGRRAAAREAAERTAAKAREQHMEELRQLQRKLREDEDSRTGDFVRDLRRIFDRLTDLVPELLPVDGSMDSSPWRLEVLMSLRAVYDGCLQALTKSHELWERAEDMATDASRSRLLAGREDVLAEVATSVAHLEKSLDQIQASAALRELPSDRLAQLRRELDQGLTVARNIQDRLDQMDAELRRSIPE